MSEVPLYGGPRGERFLMSARNLCRVRQGRRERLQGLLEEREIFIDNLLVRVHLIIEMSRPALRHGSLKSLFQVALYLPSSNTRSHTARWVVVGA